MCGVAVIRRRRGRAKKERLLRMMSAIRHRGPDGAALRWTDDGRVGLGHVRLSIVDIDGGTQPITDEATGVSIVCNGELYDDVALRERLQAGGHRFTSRSDTEVMLRLYLEYGLDFTEHLRGEFAFVLWDPRTRELIAGRDPAGIKPLFYSDRDGVLLIGSELKAILAHPDSHRGLDPAYFLGNLAGSPDPVVSMFRHIHAVPPGHLMRFGDEETATRRWWEPNRGTPRFEGSPDDAAAALRPLLRQAVVRRLRADVEVGVYLSGGLDSTAVACLMAEAGARPVAFHLSFGDSPLDESDATRRTADALGLDLHICEWSTRAAVEHLESTIDHTEGAFGNLHAVAKSLLSRRARAEGITVTLTGEGSDEAFAGYPHFKLEAIARAFDARHPDRRAWLRAFEHQERGSRGQVWARDAFWRHRARPYGHVDSMWSAAAAMGRLAPWLLRLSELGAPPEDRGAEAMLRRHPPAREAHHPPITVSRRKFLDSLASFVLPNLGDRPEMAHGVEGRTPLLDQDVLDFALSLGPEHLLDLPSMRGKLALHRAVSQLIPPHILARKKQPFLAPRWTSLYSQPRGRELFEAYLGPDAIREAGVYRLRTVQLLRLVANRPQAPGMVDMLMGSLLTVQMAILRLARGPRPGHPGFQATLLP